MGGHGPRPALVLSPNSANQAQWAARTDLFDLDGKEDQVSIDPERPGADLTTYQSVTMPKRGFLDESAMMLWAEKLVRKGEAVDSPQPRRGSPTWKQESNLLRQTGEGVPKSGPGRLPKNGNALWTLHESSLTLLRIVDAWLIILDECHHLLHHWGRVLHQLKDFFDDPIVLSDRKPD